MLREVHILVVGQVCSSLVQVRARTFSDSRAGSAEIGAGTSSSRGHLRYERPFVADPKVRTRMTIHASCSDSGDESDCCGPQPISGQSASGRRPPAPSPASGAEPRIIPPPIGDTTRSTFEAPLSDLSGHTTNAASAMRKEEQRTRPVGFSTARCVRPPAR